MRAKPTLCLYSLLMFGLLLFPTYSFADDTPTNPCADILSLADRPTVGDSVCAVPDGNAVIEAGYQARNDEGGTSSQNYPELEIRIGLPLDNEFVFLPPNYNMQNVVPRTGYNASVIGLKHEFFYTDTWAATAEGLVTLPTGSNGFGSNGTGGAFNGIVNYNFSSAISATATLGVSTQTLPSNVGGQRYNSVNPGIVLSWQFTDNLLGYVEAYGQTESGPHQGDGNNMDGGFMYAFNNHKTEIDIEVGQRINGNLGGFNNYVGAGFATMFG